MPMQPADPPESTVCLTFDFDAISLWLGNYAARSPSMISRGEFGAVGCERILRLLEREGIPADVLRYRAHGRHVPTSDPSDRGRRQ